MPSVQTLVTVSTAHLTKSLGTGGLTWLDVICAVDVPYGFLMWTSEALYPLGDFQICLDDDDRVVRRILG
jgi:hypothetical protein